MSGVPFISVCSSFMLDKRWNLLQIHDLQLCAKTLINEVQHVIGVVRQLLNEDCTGDRNSVLNQTASNLLVSLLKKLLDKTIAADNRISIPARLSLRSLARSRLKTIFQPSLPQNYLVNVYVLNGNFCVDLNVVQPVASQTGITDRRR